MNKVFKIVVCLMTVAAIIFTTQSLMERLEDRQNGTFYQFDGFYAQEPGTVDVLFVGSSRVHNNINPAELWEDYGIASYALGLNSQPINTSYYAIKEALKTQHPKVIVLEVSQIVDTSEKNSSTPSTYGMKYDLNYLEASAERKDFHTAMDDDLVFPMWHSRYDMVTKDMYVSDDFRCYPTTGEAGYKGAVEYYHHNSFEYPSDEYVKEGDIFSEVAESDMDRIVKLCSDEGVELLLTLTPSANRFENIGVTDYVNRHDVAYINTSDYYDEIGLDGSEDFIDVGHLNIYGSYKTSRFLGKYLKDNYNLEDHRGDNRYASWDENVVYHYQKIKNYEIPQVTGFGTYCDYFPNDNYIVIVSLLDGYDSEYIGQVDGLSHVLCNEVVYELGGTWVVDGHDLMYGSFGYYDGENMPDEIGGLKLGLGQSEVGESAKMVPCDWVFEVGNRTFEINRDEAGRSIKIDSVDYAITKEFESDHISTGIELIIYDKLSEQVVDAVCFDASNGWAATRNVD